MAVRPVFEAIQNRHQINADCHTLCLRKDTAFAFFSGFSDQQKKRSIRSLHQAFLEGNPNRKVLEISSRSEEVLGVSLSAFHLMLHIRILFCKYILICQICLGLLIQKEYQKV